VIMSGGTGSVVNGIASLNDLKPGPMYKERPAYTFAGTTQLLRVDAAGQQLECGVECRHLRAERQAGCGDPG